MKGIEAEYNLAAKAEKIRMNKALKRGWKDLLLSLLIVLFLMIIIVFIWDCYYAVNDDITYGQRLSGRYTGTHRPAANMLQYPLALIISTLFCVFPEVDVYGIFLFGSHFVCLFLIIKSILKKFETNRIRVIVGLCFIVSVIEIQNIVFFQFTTTAAMYAATAFFLLLILNYS